MSEAPYIGFGNDQLEKCPEIKTGETDTCPKCGQTCEIYDMKSPNPKAMRLQAITCPGGCGSFLVGIGNKDIRGIKSACSGKINLEEE